MFVVSPLFNSDESAYSFPVADSPENKNSFYQYFDVPFT
jgi:hypothetical protein